MSIEEVRLLVAERQRYDDWLEALDARQAETPERVYQRVRADYDTRRTDVLTRLAEHVAELEMLSASLVQQREELTSKLDALEDQRVEAMIRNAVGEYDNAHWDTLRADVEGQITKLTDDRALVQMELDEIQALLAQARPKVAPVPTPVVAAPAVPTPVEAAPVIDDTTAAPVVDVADVDVTAETVEMAVADGTVSDLDSAPAVVTIADSVNLVEPTADATDWVVDMTVDTPPPPAADAEMDDALAMFAETPVQPMNAVPAPLDGIDVHFDVTDDVLPTSSAPDIIVPTQSTSSVPMTGSVPPIDPFDDLAFLHSVIAPSGSQPAVPASTMTPPSVPTAGNIAEPSKTLRCTECGTMNLPTEWYCERCGGELAAF